MQDTKNLLKKKKEYQKLIDEAEKYGVKEMVDYWSLQLKDLNEKIASRIKNKKKNEKRSKK